jgi:hypothetical protein
MGANKNPHRHLLGRDDEYVRAYRGRARIRAVCVCRHARLMTAEFLLALVGVDAVIADVRRRFRCSACGRRESKIQPVSW